MTESPTVLDGADRRVRRTRAAIVSAFNRLILERGYANLTPGMVAEAADVGRSTFYEHYRGLDDLLSQALGPVLAPLALGCFDEAVPETAVRSMRHLWDNRRLAGALLGGDGEDIVLRSFAAQFASALQEAGQPCADSPLLGTELIALHLAAGQLTILGAWLAGRSGLTAVETAITLHAAGRSALVALTGLTRDASASR